METPIYNKLLALEKEKRIPFHMPGHKRKGKEIFRQISAFDITEITGYDNLHYPEGIIRESMNELKKVYGTEESWYLVNGSTVGILASIAACCEPEDGILLSRNCHKSVYNAVRLLRLKAFYFQFPLSDAYDILQDKDWKNEEEKKEIKRVLQSHKEIKAVILPSPTYEGVTADIRAIKKEINNFHIPLIIDEAHGAHFIFHKTFPKSAIETGADIVIQSAHKTLPAMTQSALLHLCSDIIPAKKIAEKLSIFETSSPSYILMASTEYAVHYMKENVNVLQKYVDNLKNFRRKCEQLQVIHLIKKQDIRCKEYDEGKLVFSVKNTGYNGKELFQILLKKYQIELEMADKSNVLAMTSIFDREKDFNCLFQALKEIDDTFAKNSKKILKEEQKKYISDRIPEKIMESWECNGKETDRIPLEKAEERVAGNFVMLYPPGIPLLVPGEKIPKEIVENLKYYLYNGYNILGLEKNKMTVIK